MTRSGVDVVPKPSPAQRSFAAPPPDFLSAMNPLRIPVARYTAVLWLTAVTAGITQAQPTPACTPSPPGLVAWWPGDAHHCQSGRS